jgi:hypothetical protein
MSDMAGKAARVAVERCGSSRDTNLKADTGTFCGCQQSLVDKGVED